MTERSYSNLAAVLNSGTTSVEIAYAKFAMDTNGAFHVPQRGLEDKRLLASYFIFPGRIGNGDHCRSLVPDQQIGTHRRNPEPNGKLRPLGISTVRDRVCMTAAMLVLEPIFEADLPSEIYAYRAPAGRTHSLKNGVAT